MNYQHWKQKTRIGMSKMIYFYKYHNNKNLIYKLMKNIMLYSHAIL
jgi:hypothetical protein